ncbi:hypothetical protein [Agromyces sp. NPDC058110]|uniref:hypothetical protein n=1 Tax=Agromyces sp. NPDC058110 TaxID=3346345 RepID=UPI0036D99D39
MPGVPRKSPLPLMAGIAVVIAVGLAGCSGGSDPSASEAPDASAAAPTADAPVFASDEEALAAAVEAYEAYLDVDSIISADPGADVESIKEVVSDGYAKTMIDQYTDVRAAGLRFEGKVTYGGVRLAQWNGGSLASVQFYVCPDVSGIRIFNSENADVTPTDRDEVLPIVISTEANDQGSLVVSGSDLWSGTDFC